ncbi:hypothetical protein F4604DRAFT_1686692 [Suillus subluteus]|nr:hypothetical protein F4604DRAFT_1686692 [Suillus subluteus]
MLKMILDPTIQWVVYTQGSRSLLCTISPASEASEGGEQYPEAIHLQDLPQDRRVFYALFHLPLKPQREESNIPKPSIRKTSYSAVVVPDGKVEGSGSEQDMFSNDLDDILTIIRFATHCLAFNPGQNAPSNMLSQPSLDCSCINRKIAPVYHFLHAPLIYSLMGRCGPKSWATIKQTEFLFSKLGQYIDCQKAQWPEHECTGNSIPLEGDLTVVETKALTKAKKKCKLHGLEDDQNMGEADVAIKAEGISTHGKKLARRKDLTCAKYAAEDDSIRAEVQGKHQEALMNWKEKCELAKAGFIQDVEQEEKIRAFNELGAHLDHIFCHLSHKTGGLKFTCIAGGRNPATGDIVVLDYHLGETETGDEFSAEYAGFSEVQAAYANFVKLALG